MDPATVASVVKTALDVKKSLDAAALGRKIERIEAAVNEIGLRLGEEVFIDVRAAFDHLAAGVRLVDEQSRRDELGHARQYFQRLANRSEDDPVTGKHGNMSGYYVSALGHLGSYYYFLLLGELHQALIEAYACAERSPALGALNLPVELFSRDYRDLARTLTARGTLLKDQHRAALQTYAEEKRSYRQWAWRIPAAAGSVVLGLLGSAVNPGLARHGLQGAMGILAVADASIVPPSRPSDQALGEYRVEEERLLAPLGREARARRHELEEQLHL
jgi:hypothetical protein